MRRSSTTAVSICGLFILTAPFATRPAAAQCVTIPDCTLVWADDHDWLVEHGLTGAVPWVLPRGDELGHMSVDGSRALAAGLTLRPLARTVFDVIDWWHSDAFGAEARASVRFRPTPEREAELIAGWRARG